MLTILAWFVFVPAVMWNVLYWGMAFSIIINSKTNSWVSVRNLRDSILSLVLLIIPGVYLFGWY
jgi:hypothetical protein